MNFIYFLINTRHPINNKVTLFFQDVENQRYVGVTSTFTKSEYLGVARQILAGRNNQDPNASDMGRVENRFDAFVTRLGIEMRNADSLSDSQLFLNCYNIIKNSNAVRGSDNHWRVIGGADSILLYLAEKTNSDMIATNDDGFKGSNSSVTPLMIREVY